MFGFKGRYSTKNGDFHYKNSFVFLTVLAALIFPLKPIQKSGPETIRKLIKPLLKHPWRLWKVQPIFKCMVHQIVASLAIVLCERVGLCFFFPKASFAASHSQDTPKKTFSTVTVINWNYSKHTSTTVSKKSIQDAEEVAVALAIEKQHKEKWVTPCRPAGIILQAKSPLRQSRY